MHPIGRIPVDRMPANVLFPEAYEASKKMIVRDFVLFGSLIVWGVVVVAFIGSA